jgi:hypothetical protein
VRISLDLKQFAALLGFAFVAAWIAFGFGNAILCLLGAAVFYAVGAVVQGELDLGDVQTRMQRSQRASR